MQIIDTYCVCAHLANHRSRNKRTQFCTTFSIKIQLNLCCIQLVKCRGDWLIHYGSHSNALHLHRMRWQNVSSYGTAMMYLYELIKITFVIIIKTSVFLCLHSTLILFIDLNYSLQSVSYNIYDIVWTMAAIIWVFYWIIVEPFTVLLYMCNTRMWKPQEIYFLYVIHLKKKKTVFKFFPLSIFYGWLTMTRALFLLFSVLILVFKTRLSPSLPNRFFYSFPEWKGYLYRKRVYSTVVQPSGVKKKTKLR